VAGVTVRGDDRIEILNGEDIACVHEKSGVSQHCLSEGEDGDKGSGEHRFSQPQSCSYAPQCHSLDPDQRHEGGIKT
jgi:hypothetical protein